MKTKIYGLTFVADTAFLTMRVEISALHELKNPRLSDRENLNIFGKCTNLHGHNYFLEVTIEGAIDKDSGLCCDREQVRNIISGEIVKKYDGQNLNHFFKSTTGEDLVREFHSILVQKLKPIKLFGVRLQETPKNFFYFSDYQFLSY
jgi:6-pyruvoyltetrahydropterin/6-carboxytetrahydropterin synthase